MGKSAVLGLFVVALAAAQPIVIKTSTILDGKGHILKNKTIMVESGRISRVADSHGNAAYDLTELTVMPGWKETHEQSALYAEGNAYATLMGGFTTVQSVGSAIDGDLRDLINAGVIPGPRILTSLRAVTENTGNPEQIRAYVRKM